MAIKPLHKQTIGVIMRTITRQECWNTLLTQNNNDLGDTALSMLGVLTSGLWVMWDDEKVEKFKKALIRKYSQESEA